VLCVGASSLYSALRRLLVNGYVIAEGGASENNRRARFYWLEFRWLTEDTRAHSPMPLRWRCFVGFHDPSHAVIPHPCCVPAREVELSGHVVRCVGGAASIAPFLDPPNVRRRVATARELVGFLWAVMRDVAERQTGGLPT
jgi:hypothetical protein